MDANKIKNFFINHGEKIVVAMVIAASAWMIYGGLSMPDMRDEKKPDQLTADANQVRSSIDEDHTEAIMTPRTQDLFDVGAETLKKQSPVDPIPYQLPNLMERQEINSALRRNDPVLVAPLELRTSGHIETIAVLGGRNNITALEDAEKLEVVKKEVTPPPSSRRNRGRGRGMESDMMDGMGMGMGMDMGMGSEEMGMGPAMGMGMGMGMDNSMMNAGPTRQFNPLNNFGFKPNAANATTTTNKQPTPQSAWFIAGTAVLPHKEIADSYRQALADAEGYTPLRDQPLYFNYEFQRAEVTNKSVEELVDADWILISNRESDLKRAAYVWAGFAPELVPIDYRDVNVTGYIPPILLSDYSSFALHPMIPTESRQDLEMKERLESQSSDEIIDINDLELTGPESNGNNAMGMGMGMGSGGSGGYMDLQMDMDMGAGMGMSMGMGMSAESMMVEKNPVQYKIMRFYDFARGGDPKSPLPGRKYVYRIRYAVQDPNFPANPLQQPKSSSLQGEVYVRIQDLMKQAEETKKRDFQRWSEWSKPSPPVSLPGLNHYFAGPVEQPRTRTFDVAGREVHYAKTPPTGKVLNYVHSAQYASVMPILMDDITEGSALANTGETVVIDPISLAIKKVPDASVLSGTTVVNLGGGQSLEIEGKDELTRPGMMLIYDETGGLKVRTEVQDQERYRIYSFAEERGL